MAFSATANVSDASQSGIQNSGNNAVINHGRNGAALPAYPFAGQTTSEIVSSAIDNPMLLIGSVVAFVVFIAVIGRR